jgi:hypothetical protein
MSFIEFVPAVILKQLHRRLSELLSSSVGLLKDFKPNGRSGNRFFRVSGSPRREVLATVRVRAASFAKAGLLYF